MATYHELAGLVSSWANRSTEILPYSTIKKCIEYALDEMYRTLRIAPFEKIQTYTITEDQEVSGKIQIPSDAIEFIQLRKRVETEGRLPNRYVVAEAKADIRSFLGDHVTLYSDYVYARETNNLLIFPEIKEDEVWELYYYRRLPDVAARFEINSTNAQAGRVNVVTAEELADLKTRDPDLLSQTLDAAQAIAFGTGFEEGDIVIGALTANWLRDEQERVVLFGALYQVFDYLDEPEQTGKYKGKFEQELAKMNAEEVKRASMGGNLNVNFYSKLL